MEGEGRYQLATVLAEKLDWGRELHRILWLFYVPLTDCRGGLLASSDHGRARACTPTHASWSKHNHQCEVMAMQETALECLVFISLRQ